MVPVCAGWLHPLADTSARDVDVRLWLQPMLRSNLSARLLPNRLSVLSR